MNKFDYHPDDINDDQPIEITKETVSSESGKDGFRVEITLDFPERKLLGRHQTIQGLRRMHFELYQELTYLGTQMDRLG